MYDYEDLKKEPLAMMNKHFRSAVETGKRDFIEACGDLQKANAIMRSILENFNACIDSGIHHFNI